jgi:hypothetical protein
MDQVGDDVRQAITWRAIAEFHRRHPAQLWVAEVEDPETDLGAPDDAGNDAGSRNQGVREPRLPGARPP